MSEKERSETEVLMDKRREKREKWKARKDKKKTSFVAGSQVVGIAGTLKTGKINGTLSQGKEFLLVTYGCDMDMKEAQEAWENNIACFRPKIVGMLHIIYCI